MQAIVLTTNGNGVFKPQKIEEDVNLPKNALDKPKNFILCTKSCDGSYYAIYSEIALLLSQHKNSVKNGSIGHLVSQLAPSDDQHGERYLVYLPDNQKQAFLLGNVVNGLKKLSQVFT